MNEERGGGAIALTGALITAAVAYLAVAPFRCTPDGTCDGLVAFHYQADSAGHWQAIAAGAVVGGAVGLLLWLLVAPEGPWLTAGKGVVSVLLVAGLGISLLSQSVLVVVGPVLVGILLWLMWRGSGRAQENDNPEPEPFSARL